MTFVETKKKEEEVDDVESFEIEATSFSEVVEVESTVSLLLLLLFGVF